MISLYYLPSILLTASHGARFTKMADLISPHGGLKEPVDCSVPAGKVASVQAEAAGLTKVPVSDADLSTVYRFGDGVLSPLVGPMNAAVYNRVLDESVIEHEGKLYAWTIPLALPVTQQLAEQLKPGQRVALVNSAGTVVATLDIGDIFPWDKPNISKASISPSAPTIPAPTWCSKAMPTRRICSAARFMSCRNCSIRNSANTSCRRAKFASCWPARAGIGSSRFKPAIRSIGPMNTPWSTAWRRCLRAGHNAGAVLNPLIGETKGDDVPATVRMQTYEALIAERGLGEGDSDPALWGPRGESVPDRVILLGLDLKMFYGGPKEAIMHGIYRQNFGFTDIVIGRKHADAPYADGSAIWGDFDAQEIFGKMKGDLKIQPVKVGFAAYYDSVGRVDLMDNHKDEKPVFISGKDVRKTLLEGKQVDPRIMRPSTSRILCARGDGGEVGIATQSHRRHKAKPQASGTVNPSLHHRINAIYVRGATLSSSCFVIL